MGPGLTAGALFLFYLSTVRIGSVHFYMNEIYRTCRCPECQALVHESDTATMLKEVY